MGRRLRSLVIALCIGGAAGILAGVTSRAPADPQPDSRPPAAPEALDAKPRIERWTQDLAFLGAEFPARHKNAFFKLTKQEWETRLEAIRAGIGSTPDFQLVVDVRRLVASIGDGHSNVWIDSDAAVPQFRKFPLACVWAADGFFVAAIPQEHAGLIGQRVVKYGAMSMDDAAERLATMRAFDNISGRKNNVPADMRDVETLMGLGLIGSDARLTITVVDAGNQETTVTLEPLSGTPAQMQEQARRMVIRPDQATLPIGRRSPRAAFGHELLADSRTFYIWYDTCSDQKDKTVAQLTEETLKALDGQLAQKPATVERVVVDFRRNGGGNSALFMAMIDALRQREPINQPGRLFGLIGRRTFSSAVMNAWQLKRVTRCVLVGEPTGGTPNGYGEVRKFTLPNSRLTVQYSTKLWNLTGDTSDAVYPDVTIEPDAAAFFSSRDPVLDRAIQYKVGEAK